MQGKNVLEKRSFSGDNQRAEKFPLSLPFYLLKLSLQLDRPELKATLGYMRKGDTLVVWKIDRLARSMKQLIETIESFHDRGIGLKSLQDPSIPAHRAAGSSSISLLHWRNSSRASSVSEPRQA
jgi:DNA invertase Pin-like site-specific DNA recombinase